MPIHGEMRSLKNRHAVTVGFIGFTLVLLALVWGASAAAPAAAGVEIGPSHSGTALPGDDIVHQPTLTNAGTTDLYRMIMPYVVNRWPPIPFTPTLHPIHNPDQDGNYTVSWTAADLADTYRLEQDTNPNFSSPVIAYSGPALSWQATNQPTGTYYYRVRGYNAYGYGFYSNVESVYVAAPTPAAPTLHPIENEDLDGYYTVSWTAAAQATTYLLEEANNPDFTNAIVVYNGPGLSWNAPNRLPGLYYYRVRGHNVYGYGPYSNTQWAQVSFRADKTDLNIGECTQLRWNFTGIKAIYISFGYGYDHEGVAGVGSRQVCPSVSTTYEALVVYPDDSEETFTEFINVTGDHLCMDPVIYSFAPTTYQVSPGEKFSIFWNSKCAHAAYFKFGVNPEILVDLVDSHIDAQIYGDTTFQLRLRKDGWGDAIATFVVKIK